MILDTCAPIVERGSTTRQLELPKNTGHCQIERARFPEMAQRGSGPTGFHRHIPSEQYSCVDRLSGN